MSRILDRLVEELELEGFEPGTPEFERLLVTRKVHRCQEMQGVKECPNCRWFIECDLARQNMMNVKFGGRE